MFASHTSVALTHLQLSPAIIQQPFNGLQLLDRYSLGKVSEEVKWVGVMWRQGIIEHCAVIMQGEKLLQLKELCVINAS